MRFLRSHPRPLAYAVLVHAVLLGVLVFSLDWTSEVKPSMARKPAPVQAIAVDASALDAELQRKKALEEKKRREAQEKLKEAERKREQEQKRLADQKRKKEQEAEAERKRKVAAEEKRKQAIVEKKRKEEARKKAEAEKKRQAEEVRKKAEAEKKRQAEEARKKAEAERKRKEDEARKRAEEEMRERLAAEQARETAQRQSAIQRMLNEYVLLIRDKVARSWIQPPGSGAGLSCTVQVKLIPSGDVIDAQIVRGSGNAAFDRSVEAAVFKASPLPVPPDPDVMEHFRSLRFEFKPGSV